MFAKNQVIWGWYIFIIFIPFGYSLAVAYINFKVNGISKKRFLLIPGSFVIYQSPILKNNLFVLHLSAFHIANHIILVLQVSCVIVQACFALVQLSLYTTMPFKIKGLQ